MILYIKNIQEKKELIDIIVSARAKLCGVIEIDESTSSSLNELIDIVVDKLSWNSYSTDLYFK